MFSWRHVIAGAEADDESADVAPRSRREKFDGKKAPSTPKSRDASAKNDARSASREPEVS